MFSFHQVRSLLCFSLVLFFLKAIKTGNLDVSSIPSLCQELMAHWKSVTGFLTAHAAQQQMQGVRNQVSRDSSCIQWVDNKAFLLQSCFLSAPKLRVVGDP